MGSHLLFMYRFKGLQNVYSTIVDLSKITFCWWHFLFYPSPLSSQLELSIDGIYTKRLKVKQFWSKIFCSQSSFHSFSSSSADKPHLVLLYCQWKIKTCLCLIDVFVLWLVFVGVVSPLQLAWVKWITISFSFFHTKIIIKKDCPDITILASHDVSHGVSHLVKNGVNKEMPRQLKTFFRFHSLL